MALLDALGTKLQTAGVGTLGQNLFLAQMQDTPDVAVCLYENQGFEPLQTFGASVTSGDRPRVRVICRGGRNDYPAARTKAEAVRACLGAIRNESLSGLSIACVIDSTGLYPMGYDKDERPAIAIDFTVWIQP